MKHLLTIAFISSFLFSFGQTTTSNMYWNNYSNFNPAMSGFQYDLHAFGTYTDYYPALSGSYSGFLANVGANIANHHGVGVVYTGDYSFAINSHKTLLNYNYQFYFKKAGRLALGTGVGIGQTKIDYDKLTFGSNSSLPEETTSFELNLGVAYNWKNLYMGFSATNLAAPEQDPLNSYGPGTGYNFHAQYAFQIAKRFQLTPRVLYAYQDGFQRLQPNLTLTYNQKFSLGVSSEMRDNFGVNLGWDIKNKFRTAYMYSVTVSKLNNGVSGGIHEFSIGYFIKTKSPKRFVNVGTPAF